MFAHGRNEATVPSRLGVLSSPPLQVAACVVRREDGCILMARRRSNQSSGGFWEIPGGKIEQGESLAQAASRELFEETNVTAKGLRPLISHIHDFPTRRIELTVFVAEAWEGAPKGCENQELAWVDPSAPSVSPILSSNKRVLTRLSLPTIVSVIGPPDCNSAIWATQSIEQANRHYAQAILFQDSKLPIAQARALFRRLETQLHNGPGTIWSATSNIEKSYSTIDFNNRSFNRRSRSSNEPLKGAIIGLNKAMQGNVLEDLDVVILHACDRRCSLGELKADLIQITQRTSAAVYALIEEAQLDATDFCAIGLQGLCVAGNKININTNEVL